MVLNTIRIHTSLYFVPSKTHRMRSSIVGQRKPQAFKRKNRKHNTKRRYSEGESSDYESKPTGQINGEINSQTADTVPSHKTSQSQMQPSHNKHDSGVDLSDGTDYGCSNPRLSSSCKEKKQHKLAVKKIASVTPSDLEFKCGMIFDIEM